VRARSIAAAISCMVAIAGCSATGSTQSPTATSPSNAPGASPVVPVDYADPAHWLAAPTTADKPVDVFYLYPTTFMKAAGATSSFSTVDDAGMVAGAKGALASQASAFAPSANIFAPYYRQVDMFFQLAQPAAQQDATIRQVPLIDANAAFQYYLEHWNHGRPFILVAHSQGAAVAKDLLSDYMAAHPDVYRRMVAAYVVGQSVTQPWLDANPHLHYATGAGDTGVIISWNSEGTKLSAPSPITQPGGIAINPITWTLDETEAPASQNTGSIQVDKSHMPVLDASGQPKAVLGLADASVNKARGVVVVSSVDPAIYSIAPQYVGVYHSSDFAFFYFDIRANAALRVANFLAAHPAS
jgi:hypothetical protein